MTKLPLDTSCQAEYEDGYIHDETQLDDVSQFVEGHNIFYDILHGLPEAEHGRMVRFSVFYKDQRHDINWADVPPGSRPIRFRDGMNTRYPDGSMVYGFTAVRFGYQYTDKNNKNQQLIREL